MMMAPAFHVRVADAQDAAGIVALSAALQDLHHAVHPDIIRPIEDWAAVEAVWRQRMSDQHRIILVAESNHRLGGFIHAVTDIMVQGMVHHARTTLYVEEIYIAPEMRRNGMARALLHGVENAAHQQGIGDVEIGVYGFNTDAMAFYQACGYDMLKQTVAKRITGYHAS